MRCSVWTMRTKKILRFLSHALSVFMLCSYDSEIIEREGICCLPTYFFIEKQVIPSVNFTGDFHTCSFNNQTRHSVRIIFKHYTKYIQT